MIFFFFFSSRRRHTRSLRDWSSDVCSSDLGDSIGVSGRKGAHTMIRTPYGHTVYAMAAEYPSAAALYEAAKHVRDAGFKRWDVYSPFPIHGMDDAMGLGKSWLSGWVLFGGI